MSYFSGKTVLITGAASGIGRLLALKIGAAGGSLVLWDIDEAGLKNVSAELAAQSVRVQSYVCDVGDADAVRATADSTRADGGDVDILVNNAGIVVSEPLSEISDREVERTFRVNTLSIFSLTRAFLPQMVEKGSGHIVTIASASGLAGAANLGAYSSSKFAAVGFDDVLRAEIRREGLQIHTTLVCPYFIDTGMFAGAKTRFSFLLPILDPDYATDRIMRAIVKRRRRLLMPRFVYVAYPARMLPVGLFDWLMQFLGASHSMDEFVGRAKDAGR
jgi:all-trans-retinol dehydrogenase (NAD+)